MSLGRSPRAHLVATVLLMGCPDASDDDAGDDTAGYCETCNLPDQIELILGAGAEDCGTVGPMADPTAVHTCLRDAAGTSAAFGVYELQGIDSQVLVGWIVEADGNTRRLSYDSNICGGAASDCDADCGPRVSATTCGPAMPSTDGEIDPFVCSAMSSTPVCEPER